MVKRWCARAVMVLAGVLLAACASDKVPAEAALKAAENAVGATGAEASQYDRDAAGVTKVNLNTATQRESNRFAVLGRRPQSGSSATARMSPSRSCPRPTLPGRSSS